MRFASCAESFYWLWLRSPMLGSCRSAEQQARAALVATPVSPSIAVSAIATPPSRGEAPVIDKKFLSLAIISTGSTFADSYTTLFARENWLAGKQGVCNIETESPYLWNASHVVRAYAVHRLRVPGRRLRPTIYAASQQIVGLPLVANSIMSMQGVGQNLANCN